MNYLTPADGAADADGCARATVTASPIGCVAFARLVPAPSRCLLRAEACAEATGLTNQRVTKSTIRLTEQPAIRHSVPVPFMQKLETRWEQRHSGLEDLTVRESVVICRGIEDVWDFITTPESSLLTGKGVIKAFRVPGTPCEPVNGEQHCLVFEEGARLVAHILETVAAERPYRRVTKWRTADFESLHVSTLELSAPGQTTLTHSIGLRVALGTATKVEPVLRAAMRESLGKTRTWVESGARFSSPPEPRPRGRRFRQR